MFKRLDLILVVVCLLVTFGIYAEGARMNRAAAKAEFTRITEDGLQALDRRMNIYLQSLNGAAGMMQSSENIEYDDFETFVESLDFENYLPGINGIEALKRLKASSATKDIPVIALTARESKKDEATGLEAGFADYLTKPINVEEVTSAVKKCFASPAESGRPALT